MFAKLGYVLNYLLLLAYLTDGTIAGSMNLKPRFVKGKGKLKNLWKRVYENTAPGFVIANVSEYAIDDEGDAMTFDIDKKGSEICTIGHRDGKLKLKISPDRERKSTYNFKVTVSDGGANRSTSLAISLYILDMNDNKPVFQKASYHATVREDAAVGTEVLQLIATDSDKGRNSYVRYVFLDSQDHELFLLEPTSGKILLKGPLDYERKTSYRLDVIAKDTGKPSLSAATKVDIDVVDYGDRPPMFNFNLSDREVNENVPIGTPIAHVQAEDGDKSINNDIGYVITQGNINGLFRLNQHNGNLTVAGLLDRELYDVVNLRIKAYEVQQPDSFKTVDLKIRLLDENDNKPVFTEKNYLITLFEDKMFPRTILSDKVKAVDKDATYPYNQITYWMTSNPYFEVLPQSGTIVLKKPLRIYNKRGVETFTVHATEKDTKKSYTANANVTVIVLKEPRVLQGKTVMSNSIKNSFNLILLITCSSLLHIILNS